MAARFLGKTSLAELRPLTVESRPVLEQYEHIRAMLAARLGRAAAELFAEPIITWGGGGTPGSVSWYAEALGEAEPLHALAADRRERLESEFAAVTATLAPLLRDPEIGPLLQAALVVASRDGIRAIDDRVVLTDWGLTTAQAATGAEPLVRLAHSPVGAFMTIPAAEPFGAAQGATPPAAGGTAMPPPLVPPPVAPLARPAAPPAAAAAAAAAATAAMMDGRPVARAPWTTWHLPAALIVAAIFLILGLWLGTRLVAERLAARPASVSLFDEAAMRQSIERQKLENATLQREVEDRRRALEGNVCLADPAKLPQTGPDQAAPVAPATVPPPPGGPQFQGSLADLLKQGVVFVLAPLDDKTITGSGFFVTRDLIVTNRHVVEHGDPDKIFVTNTKLGRLTPAHIVAMTPTATIGNLDVALLKLDAPAPVQPLSVTTTVAELDPVIAAGFPAVAVGADENYARLLRGGDPTAVPPVILTDGKISAIQETPAGTKVMPHTASISGGNSGGPLVDACGRVVGINTFINVDREQASTAKWAEKIDQVITFLAEHGTTLTPLTGPCNPAAAAAPPTGSPPTVSGPPASPPTGSPPTASGPPASGPPASPPVTPAATAPTPATPTPATPTPATPTPATPTPATPTPTPAALPNGPAAPPPAAPAR